MVLILSLMFNALSVHAYSVTYTSCGIEHTLTKMPSRIVTMNQGATELMLALGLADKMVGTAYLDDYIWPQYAEAYAKIPVLAAGYPNETTIMSVNPDFIVGSYNSAFHGTYMRSGKKRGIFSDATVGPCTGPGSEFADLNGKNYNRTGCRPQLNAAGIGTFLFADACENLSCRQLLDVQIRTVNVVTYYDFERKLHASFTQHARKPIRTQLRISHARGYFIQLSYPLSFTFWPFQFLLYLASHGALHPTWPLVGPLIPHDAVLVPLIWNHAPIGAKLCRNV